MGTGLRFRADGGVTSEVDGAPGKDIYFMGIIDILQVRAVLVLHAILEVPAPPPTLAVLEREDL